MPKKNYKESSDMLILKKYNAAFYKRQAAFNKRLKKHLDAVIITQSSKTTVLFEIGTPAQLNNIINSAKNGN